MRILLAFVVLFLLTSCDSSRIFEQNSKVGGEVWNMKENKEFLFEAKDTLASCNILINIRHNGSFKWTNLILFVIVESPDGNALRDTIDIALAENNGKWLGQRMVSSYSLRKIYKEKVRFAQSGNYKFTLLHAMRDEEVIGIADVGIRIEKAK